MRSSRQRLVLLNCAVLLLEACAREKRDFPEPSANQNNIDPRGVERLSALQPAAPLSGPVTVAALDLSVYEDNAYAVNQGKRLFRWYNCSGCHGQGGGSIGPALTDSEWLYGIAPAKIYETIVRGRPHGMPSFGGHIPPDQVWQLVAYVRSMSGQLRKDVAPSRADTLQDSEPEAARSPEHPRLVPPPP